MDPKYHNLYILAEHARTEIWLGDDEGNFVARAEGCMNEGLLPGDYVVSFGLKGKKYPIHLDQSMVFLEEELAKHE